MKSPPSSFRKLRETDARRILSKEVPSTTIGISLHSKDTIIFEDNTCSNGSFEDIAVGNRILSMDRSAHQNERTTENAVGNFKNRKIRRDNDSTGQPVPVQTPSARPVSSLEQGQRKAPRREASSEKDQSWFTLSATTIRDLPSVASTTKKREKPTLASTMTATEKLAREKQASLEKDISRVQILNENNGKAMEKRQRDKNAIATDAPTRSDSRRSSKFRLSKLEDEAREREKALILKLRNTESSSGPTIRITSEDRISKQDGAKNRAAVIMTTKESEARRMAELLDRKLRNVGCGNANANTITKARVVFEAGEVQKTMSGKMKSAKHSLKMSTPTSRDDTERHDPVSDNKKTSSNTHGILKSGVGHYDEMDWNSTSKPEQPPESPTRSDGKSCEHDSETKGQTANKDQTQKLVWGENQNDDDEESIRALHRKMEKMGMAHTILADREEEVSVYSFTEDLRRSQRKNSNQSDAKTKESVCPQLQLRDDEAIRGGGLSSGDNQGRENPNDQNDNKNIQIRDSIVGKAIQRYKTAVSAGTPATESFFLRCLDDVKEEHGIPNCTEERQNQMLPKDIAILDEMSGRNRNSNNNERTKGSSCIENGSQDSKEQYTDDQNENHSLKSSDRGVFKLDNFPDAAPMANGQKLNSVQTRRRSRTRRNGDESIKSINIDFSGNEPGQDSQTEQPSDEFSSIDFLERAGFPDAAPLASAKELNSIMKQRGSNTRSNGDEGIAAKRVRFVPPKSEALQFPEAAPLDLESGITDNADYENNAERPVTNKLAIPCSEKFVESAQSAKRMSNRTMAAISIILCVGFLLILFVVLDPLRRLTTK